MEKEKYWGKHNLINLLVEFIISFYQVNFGSYDIGYLTISYYPLIYTYQYNI